MKQLFIYTLILSMGIMFTYAQVPANDEIQNAVEISGFPFTDFNVKTQNATTNAIGTLNDCSEMISMPRVYYKYVADANKTLSLSLALGASEFNNPQSYIVPFVSSVDNTNTESDLVIMNSAFCGIGNSVTIDVVANEVYYFLVSNPSDAITFIVLEHLDTTIINIPDSNFKDVLVNNRSVSYNNSNDYSVDYSNADFNNDGEIQVFEAAFVEKLNVGYSEISSLEGIQYFSNLNYLNTDGNELQELDLSGNPELSELRIDDNNLTTLDLTQNPNLVKLFCSQNQLASVDVSQCILLEDFYCFFNPFTSIDVTNNINLKNFWYSDNTNNGVDIPQADISQNVLLETLHCNQVHMTSLDVTHLPNLVDLAAMNSQLTSIDVSQNPNLEILRLSNNEITDLNVSQNIELKQLDVSRNEISQIDLSTNVNLENLSIRYTPLETLDLSNNMVLRRFALGANPFLDNGMIDLSNHEELADLSISSSSLINLDLSDYEALRYISLQNNQFLEYVNIKNNNNTEIYSFYTINSPNLSTVCVDDINYAVTNFTEIEPLTVFVDDCSQTDVTYNVIEGNVMFDIAQDGCTEEDNIGPVMIGITDGQENTIATFSNSDGFYRLPAIEGTYDVELTNLPIVFNATPQNQQVVFSGFGNTEVVDFCLSTTSNDINDALITILPLEEARPGFDVQYLISYRNNGVNPLSGTFNLVYENDKQTYVNATVTPSGTTGNSVTFNFSDLSPFEENSIIVTMNTLPPPTVNQDDLIQLSAEIFPTVTDNTPEDNVYVLEQIVVNSYDPNDKLVLQGEEIYIEEVIEYLDFIIRFQNTGSASAINVKIEDQLSYSLDWSTIQPISASHEYRMEIINGDFIKFIFEDINLPAQQDDDQGSNGYVAYRIKPKSTVGLGSVIYGLNSEIYFDFNAPITTNFTTTTVVEENLSVLNSKLEDLLVVYPNPVLTEFKIETSPNIDVESVEITNLSGKVLYEFDASENYNIEPLSMGVYLMRIYTKDGVVIKKIIKQ